MSQDVFFPLSLLELEFLRTPCWFVAPDIELVRDLGGGMLLSLLLIMGANVLLGSISMRTESGISELLLLDLRRVKQEKNRRKTEKETT